MRKPDFDNILAVLNCQKPSRPTLFEFFLNNRLYMSLSGHKGPGPDGASDEHSRMLIRAFEKAGYDYAVITCLGFTFPRGELHRASTISLNDGVLITDRASFESYPWPVVESADYSRLERLAKWLPEGMKAIIPGPGGILENVIALTGYDNLCYLLADDPELTHEIFNAVGSRLLRHYEIASIPNAVGACISNDDWGFKTQTMLSTEDMRTYVIPWHRRIAAAIHANDKPVVLHSCGNLENIMDDIIDDIGYNGKHSYEDTILPVEEAYDRWGDRIAILGGIDLDFICRHSPEEIHQRSRRMLEHSEARGGYALGSGNSIPEYVPDEAYFAMISAATGS